MRVPDIRYTTASDGVRVAYQDFGRGPALVFVLPFFSHIEVQWEQPLITRMFDRMAEYLRVILLENRGTGLSDVTAELPTLDDRVRDIEAVVNATNLDRFSLLGPFAGAQMCVAYADRSPERIERLVLANPRIGRSVQADADALRPDAAPEAYTYETQRTMEHTAMRLGSGLTDEDLRSIASHSPSALQHPDYLRWLPRYERMWGSREAVKRQTESIIALDTVEISSRTRTPTLITHTLDNSVIHVGYGRLLHQLMPNSTMREFEAGDHFYWLAPNWAEIVDAQIEFVTGVPVEAPAERKFAVVMFTDIPSSTQLSLSQGDSRWRALLDEHDRRSRDIAAKHNGRVIKNTGDGFLFTFVSPSEAVAAALDLHADLNGAGIDIRAGIHAGEVDVRDGDISGAVVNLAARVVEVAGRGEVVTTAAIRDLLLGSDHHFEDAGLHQLKGFDGAWHLHRVASPVRDS